MLIPLEVHGYVILEILKEVAKTLSKMFQLQHALSSTSPWGTVYHCLASVTNTTKYALK